MARDSTGNGHEAKLVGATWVKAGSFAVSLDGTDDYVDCTANKPLDITGPFSIEAWIQPTRNARGEAALIGEGMGSFTLTYYNTDLCFFYVGGSGNHIKEHLTVNRWQHVAVSFDRQRLNM